MVHENPTVSFVLSLVAVILGLALIGLSAWQFAVSIGGGMSLRTSDEWRNVLLASVAALSGLFLLGVVIAKCIDKQKHAAAESRPLLAAYEPSKVESGAALSSGMKAEGASREEEFV